MWRCLKCGEDLEDSFDLCWNCGTSKDGVEDPTFQHADETGPIYAEPSVNSDPIGFDQTQIVEFRASAYWMSIAGRLGFIFGILACFGILGGRIDLLIGGIAGVIVAGWTLRAADAFRRVAERTGNDIENIVVASSNLKNVFRLQVILILIGAVAFIAIVLLNVYSR